jgi:hypothetical protein
MATFRWTVSLHSEIDVETEPGRVWQVLTDFAAYPRWNPFIVRADGRAQVGSRLTLRMQPIGARPVTLRPTVREVVSGRRLCWLGRLGVPGLLDAEHTFTIDTRDGGSRLTQHERFSGLLAPMLSRSLNHHTLPAFAAMNVALKEQAEQVAEPRVA